MSEITMNDHGLDIARAAFEKFAAPLREYLRTAPQSATATKLNRRRSHGELLELRSRSIFGLVLTLREVCSQWVNRTTEAQGSVEQGLSSSLHCHGPPPQMVRGMTQTFTHEIASTVRRTKESLTV